MNYYRVPASAGDLAPPESSTQDVIAAAGAQGKSQALSSFFTSPIFILAIGAALLLDFSRKKGMFS